MHFEQDRVSSAHIRQELRPHSSPSPRCPAQPAQQLATNPMRKFCWMGWIFFPRVVQETGAFLISDRTGRLQGVYNSREDILLCLSARVTESPASPTGTCLSLSARRDEQHPAHQMVICSTSHLCCIRGSLQPRTVSSTQAARLLLPTTLPNGSSQSHGPPRQTGSSICSSFWQRDASLSGSTSWLHQRLLARRVI